MIYALCSPSNLIPTPRLLRSAFGSYVDGRELTFYVWFFRSWYVFAIVLGLGRWDAVAMLFAEYPIMNLCPFIL